MRRQRGQVVVQTDGQMLRFGVVEPSDQGRLLHDPTPAVLRVGETRKGPVTGAAAGPGSGPRYLGPERILRRCLFQFADVEPLIGAGQQRLFGEVTDLGAVGGDARGDRGATHRFVETVLPTGHPDTGHQSPEVPLPTAGMGFVEVVEVDDQVAFRGGIEPEVSEMGVPADDRRDPGTRQVRNIVGHHDRGAAQEAVWRGHHSADPDRDQLLETALVRFHDQLHRVGPADPG